MLEALDVIGDENTSIEVSIYLVFYSHSSSFSCVILKTHIF
jgi:hypothetical protein